MRVLKSGNTPKPSVPREPRRRRRIEYHLTCPNCTCEFNIMDDELVEVKVRADPRTPRRGPYGTCPRPYCRQQMSYRDVVRVISRWEPV